MKKILIVICLIIGIGIVCEFGFNSYNPYAKKCVEAGCNNERVEGSIYCKDHKPSEKYTELDDCLHDMVEDTTEEITKETTTYFTIIAVAQALMEVQAPTVIAQVLMVVQAHIVVALRKKAVHQLADILHIVVVVLQVLHINLMMRDTSLYMMTMTMIGTDTIAIQTMPMV